MATAWHMPRRWNDKGIRMTTDARPRRWVPFGEHALHPILIALLLLILVVKPLAELDLVPRHSLGLGMLVVILAGITVLDGVPRRARRIMLALVVAGLLPQGAAMTLHGAAPTVAAEAGAMLSLSILGTAILRQTFAPGRVTLRRLEGALAAYLILGLLFAAACEILHSLAPGAFERNGVPLRHGDMSGGFIFYSFVTLSTTGYGDIVPVHPVARSLAVLEVISGTLFTTVLLARLVSLELADRERR